MDRGRLRGAVTLPAASCAASPGPPSRSFDPLPLSTRVVWSMAVTFSLFVIVADDHYGPNALVPERLARILAEVSSFRDGLRARNGTTVPRSIDRSSRWTCRFTFRDSCGRSLRSERPGSCSISLRIDGGIELRKTGSGSGEKHQVPEGGPPVHRRLFTADVSVHFP